MSGRNTRAQKPPSPPAPSEYSLLAIEKIDIPHDLPRYLDYDHAKDLADSMRSRGLFNPITVISTDIGRFELRAGLHRLTAAIDIGWATIPAHIMPADQAEGRGVSLVENIIRLDLTLDQEVEAVTKLHDEDGLSPNQIASLCSRSRAWVDRRLEVASYPDDVRAALAAGAIALGHAECLMRVHDESFRKQLLHATKEGEYSVDQLKRMVAATEEPGAATEAEAYHAEATQTQQAARTQTRACDGCRIENPLGDLGVLWCCIDCRRAFYATIEQLKQLTEQEQEEAAGNSQGEIS